MPFFRQFDDGRRKGIDLEGIFQGDLFLCGGHPSLASEDLTQFSLPGITSMAMNNTGTTFRPTLWVCADKPTCYSHSILRDPAPMKFARLLYQDEPVDDQRWRNVPNTYFYGLSAKGWTSHNLLHRRNHFAWWKNVFIISLQIAYHLGFRRVFLCGVGFDISKEKKYAYPSEITDGQVESNQRCYNDVLGQVTRALPHFRASGFQLVSCTPGSKLNDYVEFMPLPNAIQMALDGFPPVDTVNVLHSSEAGDKK